jgi:4-amino-4-deoxy-L-arabinose transferase-like glycosyltransferase
VRKASTLQVIIGLILVVLAYFFALDSIHIPNIGDEGVYIQIVRKTAESGRFLPLLDEQGIKNTKPPLLFWQGMLTTGMGKLWSFWNLRGPVVVTTLLVAFLVGLLVWMISGDHMKAFLGGLVYLGFMSTVQQGRPFLMHAAETFLLFLPLIVVYRAKRLTWSRMLICGIFLGLAALYKSFLLIFTGGFALVLVFAWESRWKVKHFLKNYGFYLMGALLLGLGIFSLWLLLDPRPDLITQDFLLGENISRFSFNRFFSGLFAGQYSLFRIWLGNLANAGLYVLFLIALVIDLVKRRKKISADEKRLWLYILGFLFVYSIPTQRQENYILPTCAAIAVLLALRWKELPNWSFRASHALMTILCGLALWVHIGIAQSLGESLFSPLSYIILSLMLVAAGVSVFSLRIGRKSFPLLALGLLLAFGFFIRPFSCSFSDEAAQKLDGQAVYFPYSFYAGYEIYRFLLPGADIKGYWNYQEQLAKSSRFLAVTLDIGQPIPEGHRTIDRIYNLKSRHGKDVVREVLFKRKFDLLVNKLVLLERTE